MKKVIAALDSLNVNEDMLKKITASNDRSQHDTQDDVTRENDITSTENLIEQQGVQDVNQDVNEGVNQDVNEDVNEELNEELNAESISRRQKKRRRLIQQRQNRKSKKRQLNILHEHLHYLKDQGWFDESNLREDLPTLPSFSIMHSLSNGFSIVLYSCTHRVKLCPELPIH